MDDGTEGPAADEGGLGGNGILVEDALDAHPALQPLVHMVERGSCLFNGDRLNPRSSHLQIQ